MAAFFAVLIFFAVKASPTALIPKLYYKTGTSCKTLESNNLNFNFSTTGTNQAMMKDASGNGHLLYSDNTCGTRIYFTF